jgi:hypothetical protein
MSEFVGLAATMMAPRLKAYTLATAGLFRGAVVMRDSSAAGEKVKAPTGALVLGLCGVLVDEVDSGGTDANTVYNFAIQPGDIVPVLLDAGQAVTVGDKLVASDTDGSVKAYSDAGGDDNCTIIGFAEETRTAGAANELIKVRLAIFDIDQS